MKPPSLRWRSTDRRDCRSATSGPSVPGKGEAAKRAADQIRQHGTPDPALPFSSADHGDALWRKNRAQQLALEVQHVQRPVGAIGWLGRFGFYSFSLLLPSSAPPIGRHFVVSRSSGAG